MQNLLIFTTGLLLTAAGIALWWPPAALMFVGLVLMGLVIVVSFLPQPPQRDAPKQ